MNNLLNNKILLNLLINREINVTTCDIDNNLYYANFV